MLESSLGGRDVYTRATNHSDHSDNESWHSCNQSNASSPSASSIKSHSRYFNVSPKFPRSLTLDSDSPYSPSDDFRYDNRYENRAETTHPNDSRATSTIRHADNEPEPRPKREPEPDVELEYIPAFEPGNQPVPAFRTPSSAPPGTYHGTGLDPEWDHPPPKTSRTLSSPENGSWSPCPDPNRPEPNGLEPHFPFRVSSPQSEVRSTSSSIRLTESPPPPQSSLHTTTPLFPQPPRSPLGRSGATSASPQSAASGNMGGRRGKGGLGRESSQHRLSPQSFSGITL